MSTPSRTPANFFPPNVSALLPKTDAEPSLWRTTALSAVFDVPIKSCLPNTPAAFALTRKGLSCTCPTMETPLPLTEIALISAGAGCESMYVPKRSPSGESFQRVNRFISPRSFVTGSAITPSGFSA